MPVLTAAIALLVSVASFVFALLVFAENRRLEREKHRAVALSSTHTASLLLQEALDVVGKVDAFFDAHGVELDDDTAREYADYRQSVKDDHAKITKAMSEVAYGNLAVIECRALAAQATLVVYRTIDNRKALLRLLTQLRDVLATETAADAPTARGGAAPSASGDGAFGPLPQSEPSRRATSGWRPPRRSAR
ncbi:hypothetical protein [Rubrivirga marina]|uniref:Uncharacterized protein n=1 Tax=Rubrivirga marina TaxID=1196024 RepID=A0A271IX52_9BACT|nr:hypothetical protein [Rubrivirga marina]PAP75690.1 hypothetical protein BSZ37_04185 [Rubrivirga marina]